MPAWGKSMADPYIWGMVAFLQQLPSLDAEQYKALATSSGGHQHGGGESKMHNHEGQHEGQKGVVAGHHDASAAEEIAEAGDHHGERNSAHAHEAAAAPSQDESTEHAHPQVVEASHDAPETPATQPKTHTHADGKEHTHAK
jgi:hypothetical protein